MTVEVKRVGGMTARAAVVCTPDELEFLATEGVLVTDGDKFIFV